MTIPKRKRIFQEQSTGRFQRSEAFKKIAIHLSLDQNKNKESYLVFKRVYTPYLEAGDNSTPGQERDPLHAFVSGSSFPSNGQSQYPSFIHSFGMELVFESSVHPVRQVIVVESAVI